MSVVPDNTLGGHVKAGNARPEHAAALAGALFDGKREMKVGALTLIAPAYDKMTAHERLILKGLFLKAQVRS